MISCREVATALMSDELRVLPWRRRIAIRLHLALCGACSRLARQLAGLRAAARTMAGENTSSPGFEERLVRKLRDR